MQKFLCFSICLNLFSFADWHYDLDDAMKIARKEHKDILINFSGSDWCGPCIRMRKEIFESNVFNDMADTYLVLVSADFPRKKKDQLPVKQQQINNAMADRYNPQGKFPYTVLLNDNGIVLRVWDGFPNNGSDLFTKEVQNSINNNR
jgi:thioredoxin-related protein